MARDRKLIVGALNITTQPHSPENYKKLFRKAFMLRKRAKLVGDNYALLVSNRPYTRDQRHPLSLEGDIFKYTEIDSAAPWVSFETNDFATDNEISKISIPEHLRPNGQRFSYIFFPEKHILFYEGYTSKGHFAPTVATRFFYQVLNQPELASEFGSVDVTHFPDKELLSDALKIPHKSKIQLAITRPNADDLEEAEAEIMERLNKMNVRTMHEEYDAAPQSSIIVDDKLETLAKIAAKNGVVKVIGKNNMNKRVEFSTTEHPWIEEIFYNPDVQQPHTIFENVSLEMVNKLKRE
jgi:hypothetical protein